MRSGPRDFTESGLLGLPGVLDVARATPSAGHVTVTVELGFQGVIGPYLEALAPIGAYVHVHAEGDDDAPC